MKGEKPLRKRKKKMPSPSPSPSPVRQEPNSIVSLPNDLLFNCISRVSRLYYPTLSLVCKTFRSIVASPELYETRSRLNRTEKCLYLCLTFQFDTNTHWFTLCREPNKNVADKSSGYRLVQIPSPFAMVPAQSSSVIAVGSDIYKIGGAKSCQFKFKTRRCSYVSVLDCRSHRWRQAPGMRLARSSSSTVSVVDGKIYVAGGCEEYRSTNWMEVYDPMTKTWGSVTNPHIQEIYDEYQSRRVLKGLGLEGKLYMFGEEFKVYNPKEGKWNDIGEDRPMWRAIDSRSCISSSSCVVDNVLFIWEKGLFKWYDFKVKLWKDLNGVEGLPDLSGHEYCKMVDLGGKIAVLWEESLPYKGFNKIWCAEVSLERRDGDEIWGKVEWFDNVLSVHYSGSLLDANVVSAVV
ncbi:hypothetical protein CARUB_v10021918mg [Capsella rubella]|uniref:F-box domain-containing protein n=2 Tax=Capsella rubella TaxID=81985 RepID=R0GFE7_9BRAS|nr:hypothetical protein CARUB_v10021918mg [Capsella rubella]